MRVGIVIAAYNAASWIGDAIASVIAQTYRDWILVVVDDGSADGTADVVGGFADPRIRLVRQANAGVSAARNRGGAAPGAARGGPGPAVPRRRRLAGARRAGPPRCRAGGVARRGCGYRRTRI